MKKLETIGQLQKVHLKGYKSIRDLTVELQDGLNIIIGENGSGKTNFFEFLKNVYSNEYERLFDGRKFECYLKGETDYLQVVGEPYYLDEVRNAIFKVEAKFKDYSLLAYYASDNKKIQEKGSFHSLGNLVYLTFNNPLNAILKTKLSLKLSRTSFQSHSLVVEYTILSNVNNSANGFLNEIFDVKSSNEDALERKKSNAIKNTAPLLKNLKSFSPIKNMEIDWSAARHIPEVTNNGDSTTSTFLTENIDFKFFVNNEWLYWSQLSDGTKRLFYLIGSVTYAEKDSIILIEEPEIGVHPHQLLNLMNFLKEESLDKQIIISTHSPQVLNCLKADELDRIIIARHEGKAGTQMYHLSEEEKGYATAYMENEAFLSDYWTFSGFTNDKPLENA